MNNLNEYAFKTITEEPIILDFSKCETVWDIHELLRKKFGFHDNYGRNWDALWDCMRDVFEDGKHSVEVHSFDSMNNDIQKECKILFQIFDRVVETSCDFSYKIVD